VEVFLGDDVAAGGKVRVFAGDERGVECSAAAGVFGAIDEAEKVAVLEVAKAMGFVDIEECGADAFHDLGNEFEAEVHAFGADVKEKIGGGGGSMAVAGAELAEGVELCGARVAKEFVPRVGAEGGDAGEPAFDAAKIDRAEDAGEIGAEAANSGIALRGGFDAGNEEDGAAREGRKNGLRSGDGLLLTNDYAHANIMGVASA
jgi:hypothetical protein